MRPESRRSHLVHGATDCLSLGEILRGKQRTAHGALLAGLRPPSRRQDKLAAPRTQLGTSYDKTGRTRECRAEQGSSSQRPLFFTYSRA